MKTHKTLTSNFIQAKWYMPIITATQEECKFEENLGNITRHQLQRKGKRRKGKEGRRRKGKDILYSFSGCDFIHIMHCLGKSLTVQ